MKEVLADSFASHSFHSSALIVYFTPGSLSLRGHRMINYDKICHDPDMRKFMTNIETGLVNKRNAIAEVLEPKLRLPVTKRKGKKVR